MVSANLVYAASDREDVENVKRAEEFIDGILKFNVENDNSADICDWILRSLPDKIGGTAEWYSIGISQYLAVIDEKNGISGYFENNASSAFYNIKYDMLTEALTKYEIQLERYLSENNVKNASARLKFALALASVSFGPDGSMLSSESETGGSAEKNITKCMSDGSIGGMGTMSLVFGLHLVNNGYVFIDIEDSDPYSNIRNDAEKWELSRKKLIDALIDEQLKDGGWSVIGNTGDVDVTAMVLQALAPIITEYNEIYDKNSETNSTGASLIDSVQLKKSIDRGLKFLSEKQLDSGAFKGFGIENAESTAQVLACLSALDIDCANDERFIKNNNTVLDGLDRFDAGDGSFSHEIGGEYNATATVQTFYALVSYVRMKEGLTPLYVLDSCKGKREAVKNGNDRAEDGDRSGDGAADNTGDNNSEDRDQNNDNIGEDGNQSDENIGENINKSDGVIGEDGNQNDGDMGEDGNIGEDEKQSNVNISENENQDEKNSIEEDAKKQDNTGENENKNSINTEEDKSRNNGNAETDKEKNIETNTETNEDENKVQTDDGSKNNEENNNKGSLGYKFYAYISIIALTLISCAIFAIRKKHWKNYVFTAVIAAGAILIVAFTDFKSAESYYSGIDQEKENATGTVTMSIRCDILNGMTDSEYIPKDGCILPDTEFKIKEGETAYEILIEAARQYGISIDHKGGSEIIYISGINYLYELDYGDLSGWVYKVNGELPSVGCAGYKLSDGDKIEWCYTLDLGNDCLDD